MTPEREDEIQARCERATPGPWSEPIQSYRGSWVVRTPDFHIADLPFLRDATFLAHARRDVPDLLGALARARAAQNALVDALVAALSEAQHFIDVDVRAWLPDEHANCGINSGCAHAAEEQAAYDACDDAVEKINTALKFAEESTAR